MFVCSSVYLCAILDGSEEYKGEPAEEDVLNTKDPRIL